MSDSDVRPVSSARAASIECHKRNKIRQYLLRTNAADVEWSVVHSRFQMTLNTAMGIIIDGDAMELIVICNMK